MTDRPSTPVLIPGEPTRFHIFDSAHERYLLPIPQRHPPTFARFGGRQTYEASRVIVCDVRRYRSSVLGLDVLMGAAEGDETRAFVALRLAEMAILFVEVLAEIGGGGRGDALAKLTAMQEEWTR